MDTLVKIKLKENKRLIKQLLNADLLFYPYIDKLYKLSDKELISKLQELSEKAFNLVVHNFNLKPIINDNNFYIIFGDI